MGAGSEVGKKFTIRNLHAISKRMQLLLLFHILSTCSVVVVVSILHHFIVINFRNSILMSMRAKPKLAALIRHVRECVIICCMSRRYRGVARRRRVIYQFFPSKRITNVSAQNMMTRNQ